MNTKKMVSKLMLIPMECFINFFDNYLTKNPAFENSDDRKDWNDTYRKVREKVDKLYQELREELTKEEQFFITNSNNSDSTSHTSDRCAESADISVELKPVYIPRNLAEQFENHVEPNTSKGLECGGYLCGREESGGYIISEVIISKQDVTSNSFDTKHEEEYLECIESANLITIGWIRTHPTQTAFMSSKDLHVQVGHQIQLAESVAIVCAPKYNEVKFFCLTPDYGIDFIRKCKKGGFHEHNPNKELYTTCKHIVLADLPLVIRDLR